MELSDSAARALCTVAEKAMVSKGVDPLIAAAFAERACRPAVKKGLRRAARAGKKAGKKAVRKGKKMTRKTQLAINRGRRRSGLKPIKWKKKGK
ncbi:MAG TPA: hypothetical protein EYO33_22580 [Phycisphaerales bacterium]|nr:hypothetical protein [Phycisphaerales bacterium]